MPTVANAAGGWSKVGGLLVAWALAAGCAGEGTAPEPVELTTLAVSPASITLAVNTAQQFGVAGQWSDGGSATPVTSWSATGGTVSPTGLFAAGGVAGTYRVIATHEASGLADTATVTLTAPPAAGTILLQEGFEDANGAARGWYDNTTFTTSTAEHRPGGTRSLVWSWSAGAVLPTFGAAARHLITPTTQLYVSYWMKTSGNWVGSGVSYHPHEMQFLTTASAQYAGPAFTRLTTYIEHNYQNGGVPQLGTTDGENVDAARVGQDLSTVTEARAVSGCNGNTDGIATDCYPWGPGTWNNGKMMRPAGNAPTFLPTAGAGYKGDWHHVEVFFRMNSIVGGVGQTDGIAQYWFDGALVIDRRNVLFRTGANATLQWNQFMLGPYIGVGSPVAQSMYIDDLLIATDRP